MPSAIKQKLLYFCPGSIGGISQYGHEQCNALAKQGFEILMLCPEDYPYAPEGYSQEKSLAPKTRVAASRILNRLALATGILRDHWVLDRWIARGEYRRVLFATYSEYLAPVWAAWLRGRMREGVEFSAVVHDPVRDYVVGPLWWHQWSVRCGYSFLKNVFVHEAVELGGVPEGVKLTTMVIPHGPFAQVPPREAPAEVRLRLGIPHESTVMLLFGYIRDSKNLDLVIQAMGAFHNLHLLVAGTVSTQGQKPLRYYQDLAKSEGVAERCHWNDQFIPAAEVGNLFAASDVVLLTYSAAFRSASGVLNTAAAYHKPCLASAGQGSLASVVKNYQLGVWVEPDSVEAIRTGLAELLENPPVPDWAGYEADHSWARNAQLVAARL
jgi:glycosyltransferase involved in cell wall biosynthesis